MVICYLARKRCFVQVKWLLTSNHIDRELWSRLGQEGSIWGRIKGRDWAEPIESRAQVSWLPEKKLSSIQNVTFNQARINFQALTRMIQLELKLLGVVLWRQNVVYLPSDRSSHTNWTYYVTYLWFKNVWTLYGPVESSFVKILNNDRYFYFVISNFLKRVVIGRNSKR